MTEVKMVKRVNVADELAASVEEGMTILRGEVTSSRVWHPPAQINVRAIRKSLSLSQPEFAAPFGFGVGVGAVRDWEQGRRQSDPVARTLLVIEHSPNTVTDALDAAQRAA
jgi:putative transcriptional regulator